jgi:hypothetical protein
MHSLRDRGLLPLKTRCGQHGIRRGSQTLLDEAARAEGCRDRTQLCDLVDPLTQEVLRWVVQHVGDATRATLRVSASEDSGCTPSEIKQTTGLGWLQ